MFRHRHRRDGHASSGPDYYLPIFKQTDLNDYNPSTYECKAVPDDIEAIEAILSSQTSDRETRGIRQGDLFDHDDHEFYSRQKVQGFPQRAYSDKFFQSSEQNPEKWCEIGVTFRGHASVVIHDITGADTDKPKKYFEYLGIAKEEPQSSRVGDIIRLHLARRRGDNEYDLWFHHPRTDEESGRYYSVCRIRTTDRMIKYNAGLSFPRYYKKVTSDCATFAHNFLVKTLNCVYAEGHIEKKKLDSIVKNLVKHNHVAEGTVGETEGVSRRNKVLGDTGGTLLESGGTLVGSS